jgi:hypothetical protein
MFYNISEEMKALRIILFIGGLAMMVWGATDYFSGIPEVASQGIPKSLIGLLAVFAAIFTKNSR